MSCGKRAETLSGYVDEIEETHGAIDGAPPLDLAPVRSSLADLLRAAEAYESALEGLSKANALDSREQIQKLNETRWSSQKPMGQEEGFPAQLL
jgi:hypothetical protein